MASVYANKKQDRFFHIPDDVDVANGPMEIRSLKGRRLMVDPQAASAFEVSESEAKALVKGEVSQFTEKASSALAALGGVLRAAREQSVPTPGPDQTPPENVVASFLGITPEQLRDDPGAVREGMRSVLSGLGQALADAAADSLEDTRACSSERSRSSHLASNASLALA